MVDDERFDNANGEKHEVDLALRRYTAVLGYMQYEANVFWTRAHHFLVANAALLGFVATQLPVSVEPIAWARLYTLGCVSGGGLALSILWLHALRYGNFYIDRWQSILVGLEGLALGEIRVLRDKFPQGAPTRARTVARRTAFLILALWVGALLYIFFCSLLKLKGWELM